ncbi:hypothetical protein PPACK8108_LOCUS905, partial [Phakopsora pachyrhizi]
MSQYCQTPYYGYGQPDYVTGHAEDNLPPHGYPRIYPEYQSPYDINPSRSTPQSSYMQDHARSDDDQKFPCPNNNISLWQLRIKGKDRQSQDFGQSPHSE